VGRAERIGSGALIRHHVVFVRLGVHIVERHVTTGLSDAEARGADPWGNDVLALPILPGISPGVDVLLRPGRPIPGVQAPGFVELEIEERAGLRLDRDSSWASKGE
jgi:hypothetical protein